ncbi:MAG: PH domain-containing protein [Methanomassiliicoccales archaeon]|nr:PH domain-containing protein [Methanomassiliicoccales archaeon]NYT15162.1 PH domain-containing protein [Methanomassiliicoccales archaeon]
MEMVELNTEFKPSPRFKSLYFIYLTTIVVVLFLWWQILLIFFVPWWIWLAFFMPVLVVTLFTAYWIPKFWQSMVYTLSATEINWNRGVWFRKTGIVPYNRITNVDISQGPISRSLRLAHLSVQTAGYSGSSQSGMIRPEIRLEGIEAYESLRDQIMDFVRRKRPEATETHFDEEQNGERIVLEITRIRELLEELTKQK